MSRRTLHVARDDRTPLAAVRAHDAHITLRRSQWRTSDGDALTPERVVALIFEHDAVVLW